MQQTDTLALSIRNLNKIYAPAKKGGAPHHALKDVNLSVRKGSIFGLLGPNGAGKSTLINIIAGLVIKTSGTLTVDGYDLDTHNRQARSCVGVVPQEIACDAFFHPRQTLNIQAGLYGIPKAERITDEILDFIGLTDKADSYVRSLSGGMKRRLMIGKAMVHQPPILILDEPTAGVDVELRRQLWSNVRKLNDQGVTIILTTHYLEEAEALCDEIAIIHRGTIITSEPTACLLNHIGKKSLTIHCTEDITTIPPALQALGAERIEGSPRTLTFRYAPADASVSDYLQAFHDTGLTIADLTTQTASLEDVFLSLTQNAD